MLPEQRRLLAAVVVLLSMAAGATDALSLLHLGGAFSSIITGNLVVVGVSATLGDPTTMLRAAVAIVLYGVGSFTAARLVLHPRLAPPAGGPARPRAVVACLAVEAALLVTLWIGWQATGHQPGGPAQLPLIALAGTAMGVQSVAAQALGRSLGHGQLSTTYLTGALTQLVSTLATPGGRRRADGVQALALAGMLAGAAASALLVHHLPWVGPLPATVLTVTSAGLVAAAAARGKL